MLNIIESQKTEAGYKADHWFVAARPAKRVPPGRCIACFRQAKHPLRELSSHLAELFADIGAHGWQDSDGGQGNQKRQ